MKTMWKVVLPSCLLAVCVNTVRAQGVSEIEKQAYCQYVEDQGKAEKTLDTGLEAYGRLGQSDTDTAKEAVMGLQASLSKQLQGRSVARSAGLECELYRETLDVDRATKFTFVGINQRVAVQRVQALTDVLSIVDEEIATTEKRRKAGDATVEDVLALTEQREAVFTQFIAAQADATQGVPDWRPVDLNQAMDRIDGTTRALEAELNHQQALQTWDVALIGGVLKPFAGTPADTSMRTQPFVALNVTYNLNARAYRRQLDDATTALIAMRHQQNDELYQRVIVLEKGLTQNLAIEKESLPILTADADRLGAEYAQLQKTDSPEALRMRAKVHISLALATAELRMAHLRITLLSQDYASDK